MYLNKQPKMDSNFIKIQLVVLIAPMAALLLGINVYLLRLYLHPQDKRWSQAPYAKIIVILALTFCQAQALMIPLDVVNSQTGAQAIISMRLFWMIFYLILFVFLCMLVPGAILFYESDPQRSLGQRLCRSLAYLLVALIVPGIIVGLNMIKQINLRKVNTDNFMQFSYNINNEQLMQKNVTFKELYAWQPLAIIQLLTFVGWFFVIFFAGVGLFALPMDFINQFRHRPKVKRSNQMKSIKAKLIKEIKKLIEQGQGIKQFGKLYENNQEAGCCQVFKGNRKVNSKFTEFKVKYHEICNTFTMFNLQLKLSNTNPIIPILKLIIGIIFFLTSLAWVIQIIFAEIVQNQMLFKSQSSLDFYAIDSLFISLDESNINLLSTAFFAYLCLYMMWCVQKGSIKLGIRLPFCCRFYPLKEKGTTMNGLLMNCVYLILGSVGVTQLCVGCFPQYARNAQATVIFQQFISRMGFYSVFYKYSIFPIALISWTFLSLIYLLITCNKKPAYLRQIDNIRKNHLEQLQLSEQL